MIFGDKERYEIYVAYRDHLLRNSYRKTFESAHKIAIDFVNQVNKPEIEVTETVTAVLREGKNGFRDLRIDNFSSKNLIIPSKSFESCIEKACGELGYEVIKIDQVKTKYIPDQRIHKTIYSIGLAKK